MIKAIIFDCWHTVFQNTSKINAFAEFAQRIGQDICNYDFMKSFEKGFMIGKHKNLDIAIKNFLSKYNIKPSTKLIAELKTIYFKSTEVITTYPETVRVLKKLRKKYKLGLISNTHEESFVRLDELYNVYDLFDVVLASYKTKLLKPDPKVFHLMLKKLGVKKEETLMVGDSLEDDVEVAKKLGIKAVLLDRRNRYPDYPDRITSLEELGKFLE